MLQLSFILLEMCLRRRTHSILLGQEQTLIRKLFSLEFVMTLVRFQISCTSSEPLSFHEPLVSIDRLRLLATLCMCESAYVSHTVTSQNKGLPLAQEIRVAPFERLVSCMSPTDCRNVSTFHCPPNNIINLTVALMFQVRQSSDVSPVFLTRGLDQHFSGKSFKY